ncbi:mitochondrial translation elongation factor G [Tieghemostelium lacteum]|uniref:Mitochondrial translation elongation factor G n=1 Tax=Tieghemostelium lacteum TaxID=361077 RepID=A0A151Z9S0_TIELA|nr:mitochondrial translation elongation factor G [Tieghemostelium lacteum]|eukprot:KYQ90614.1 mitochondrial translation elongation factor G [Tieghemostelium lacteum]
MFNSQIRSIFSKFTVQCRYFSSSTTTTSTQNVNNNIKKINELNKYRNIGIIAHVDAGKTTTCERMLYYSGLIKRMGEVHKGDTMMDHLKLERERGITITAATVSFPWRQHRINLVDTPGHVDFTVEVERSVRVMDGAVAIFDAVSGVQAQSITVWNQSERYKVPRVAFVNKMDREGATMEKTIKMMKDRLQSNPIMVQYPMGSGPSFYYVIDLLTMKVLSWSGEKGEIVESQNLSEFDEKFKEKAIEYRKELITKLCDLDETILQTYLEADEDESAISESQIKQSLRKVTMEMKAVPVLFGSSLQNKGVQQVLDSVIDYLPSPVDRVPPIATDTTTGNSVKIESNNKSPLCALAFKVVHDKKRGLIVYSRVYSGVLRPGQMVLNTNRNEKERVSKLLQINADEMEDLQELKSGDIGALLGLKNVKTGDTLIIEAEKGPRVKLEGIKSPPPVFFCLVEADTENDIPLLTESLEILQKEDPSFYYSFNENQQIQISGMGELHLEIIKDRLDNHFKVPCSIGKMQVSYKGTLTDQVSETSEASFDVNTGNGVKSFHTGLGITLEPIDMEGSKQQGNEIVFNLSREFIESMDKQVLERIKQAIQEGIEASFQRGLPLGFPVTNVRVIIHHITYISEADSPPMAYRTSTIKTMLRLGEQANPIILEPMMKIEISVDERYLGSVLSDLSSQRRATIQEVGMDKNTHLISAIVPLKEMIGYSTQLRSFTQGNASYTMELLNYGKVSFNEKEKIIREMRGY